MHPLLVALLIVAGLAVLAIAYRQDRKRRRLLHAWARSHGFGYHDGRQDGWEREYPGLGLLDRGHSLHTGMHLEGEVDGHRARCLDYRYTTGGGKNRRTHRHGVVVLDTGQPVIPLRIRREHLFEAVREFQRRERRFGGVDAATGERRGDGAER